MAGLYGAWLVRVAGPAPMMSFGSVSLEGLFCTQLGGAVSEEGEPSQARLTLRRCGARRPGVQEDPSHRTKATGFEDPGLGGGLRRERQPDPQRPKAGPVHPQNPATAPRAAPRPRPPVPPLPWSRCPLPQARQAGGGHAEGDGTTHVLTWVIPLHGCPVPRGGPEPQPPPRPACLHLRAPTGGAEMQRPGEPGRTRGPGLGRPVCEPSGGLGVPEAVAPVGDSEGGSPAEGSPVPGYPGGPEGSGKCAPFHHEPPQGRPGVRRGAGPGWCQGSGPGGPGWEGTACTRLLGPGHGPLEP